MKIFFFFKPKIKIDEIKTNIIVKNNSKISLYPLINQVLNQLKSLIYSDFDKEPSYEVQDLLKYSAKKANSSAPLEFDQLIKSKQEYDMRINYTSST